MTTAITALAAAIAISITALATGIAQRAIGSAGVGALAEKPELMGSVIILIAIPETLVILGFAVSAIILLAATSAASTAAALTAVAAALAISITALATGIAQRAIGSAGVGALAEQPNLVGSVIILIAIPETLVILGFAVAAIILLSGG